MIYANWFDDKNFVKMLTNDATITARLQELVGPEFLKLYYNNANDYTLLLDINETDTLYSLVLDDEIYKNALNALKTAHKYPLYLHLAPNKRAEIREISADESDILQLIYLETKKKEIQKAAGKILKGFSL